MRWAKTSLRNSFFGWLVHDAPPASSARIETIRTAMLEALEQSSSAGHVALERRILFATDIGALWYVRPDLMNTVAAHIGEARARERLAAITTLFDGMVPGSRH
jgi:hypothetical protein